jgi:hypothetical protein
MEKFVDDILSEQSIEQLNQLIDDISFYTKEHSRSIDADFMSSILFQIPQYVCRLKGLVPVDVPHSKRLRLTEPLEQSSSSSNPEPKPSTPPANRSLLSNLIQLNDKGMTPGEQRLWDEQAMIRPEEGESLLISSESQPRAWIDHLQPRKPKYYNRCKSGYLWTEYNRMHYTEDNPPPVQVLGYRFNLFYPDLIDHLKTPTYRLEPGKGGPNTLTLVFTASPPYEPVDFQIVNKEWETSHRLGFKCVFERGALQLYFNFKRDAVRR